MALGASEPIVITTRDREGVVERCAQPSICAVATLASRGKTLGLVVWIGCALVIGQVAIHAVARGASKDSPHVALGTIDRQVRPGQRVRAVIKNCVIPLDRGVAHFAIGGKTRRRVGRFRRSVVVTLVAVRAIAGKTCEDPSRMTLIATHQTMGSGERKRIVGEQRRDPTGCVVTQATIGGESRSRVIRIRRRVVIRLMAIHATTWGARIGIARMTQIAGRLRVGSGQWKT